MVLEIGPDVVLNQLGDGSELDVVLRHQRVGHLAVRVGRRAERLVPDTPEAFEKRLVVVMVSLRVSTWHGAIGWGWSTPTLTAIPTLTPTLTLTPAFSL